MTRLFTVLFVFICSLLNAQSNEGAILVESFSVKEIDDFSIKIVLNAKSRGNVSIGSYAVSVQGVYHDKEIKEIPGLKLVNDLFYVVSKDFPTNEILLKDNGFIDEDARDNYFTITLNTSNWTNGVYDIRVSAMNRPATGNYVSGGEIYRYVKGVDKVVNYNSKIADVRHQVIWGDKDYYAYFPTLSMLDDKRLFTRFATRINPSHIDTTGGIKTMVSSDLGKSWIEVSNNFSVPNKPNKDGTLVNVTGGGWVYVNSGSIETDKPKITQNISNSRSAYLSNELTANYSYDSGKKWTKKRIGVPEDILGLIRFSTFRSDDGLRVIGLYGNRNRNGSYENTEIYFVKSVDDGINWDFVYLTPKGMDNPSLNPTEPSIIQTADGKLLTLFRTESTIYSSTSSDRGKTWTKPKDTGIKGYPPYLLQLRDGRLICFYGYRYNPMGIRACISYDSGASWDVNNEIVLRKDGLSLHSGNIGYPKAVELDNGEIFVIYYITTNGKTPVVAGTHFRLK